MTKGPQISPVELKARRDDIRRGLLRVNTAGLAIILVVVGLAIVAIFAAFHANRNAAATQAANARAQQELWKSYLAQANAGRLSRTMGRKQEGQEAIAAAARIQPSLELRNEAIAHAALLDFQEEENFRDFTTNGPNTAFDHEVKRYAVGEDDGTIRVFAWTNHMQLAQWREGSTPILLFSFSPDGRHLGAISFSDELFVFDLEGGKLRFRLPKCELMDFSGNGSVLAVKKKGDSAIYFLDPNTGQEIKKLAASSNLKSFLLHPTDNIAAINTGKEAEVVAVDTGRVLQRFQHERSIDSMAWTKKLLAVGDGKGEIRVWNLKNRKSNLLLGHQSYVDSLRFNPQGDLLVSTSWDGSSAFWDPFTGEKLFSTKRGFALQFSADGERLGYFRKSGRGGIGVWRALSPRGYREIHFAEEVDSVRHTDFSPDGKLFIATRDDGIRIFSYESSEPLLFHPISQALSAFFLPDGKSIFVSTRGGLLIWPLDFSLLPTSQVRLGQPRTIPLPKTERVGEANLSYDRRHAVLPVGFQDTALIDLENPTQPVLFSRNPNTGLSSISPDRKWVATGNFHGHGSRVWDAATGKKLLDLARGNANAIFSPDGKILLIAGDKEFRFFETGSWKLVRSIPTENSIDLPGSAAFSRDGALLAIVTGRTLVKLFDAKTWNLLASLASPQEQTINCLASFSWDGKSLAVGTGKDVVQLWDLATIRQDLGKLGLDWGESNQTAPPLFAAATSAAPPQNWRTLMVLAGCGMALVIFCAIFVLRRQRQLIASYMTIDTLMEQRDRELEMAQTEIIQSQKMKALGTLAAGIAHDFNNLLSVIRMSSKLIGREAKEGSEIHENVGEIEEAVQQGKKVVRSMLGYSRDGNDEEMALSLPDLVEDTVGLLSKQFLSGVTLNLELDRDLPTVHGSRSSLEQILLNLVVNASESMKGKGALRIVVRGKGAGQNSYVLRPRPAKGYLELSVADTGPGIAPEILPRIFEPFFTTKLVGADRGTGLGLSMVYTIAEQAGLGIGVRSVLGEGAEFSITIPAERGLEEVKIET